MTTALRLSRLAACMGLCIGGCNSIAAAPLPLSQTPPQVFRAQPAPKIYLSLNDGAETSTQAWSTWAQALAATFSADALDIGDLRLGWRSFHGCTSWSALSEGASADPAAPCGGDNRAAPLTPSHYQAFVDFLNRRQVNSATRTAPVVAAARSVRDEATANVDGDALAACQRDHHLIISNGAHPEPAAADPVNTNADGLSATLPNGSAYDPLAGIAALYRDDTPNTLADEAWQAWAQDARPDLPNHVSPDWRITSPQAYGVLNLPPEWNPRNDPANWQHLNTHAVAYAVSQPDALAVAPFAQAPRPPLDPYGGDLLRLAAGQLRWPNASEISTTAQARRADLWHATINGHGRFAQAHDAPSLQQALDHVLDAVHGLAEARVVSGITSASTFTRDSTTVLQTMFETPRWHGDVQAWRFSAVDQSWQAQWSASAQLNQRAPQTRTIYAWLNHGLLLDDAFIQQPSARAWGAVEQLRYLIGVRDDEAQHGGNLRDRSSPLGDIVHSPPWRMPPPQRGAHDWPGHAAFRQAQAQRASLIWVGANDGMLHAFDQASGEEALALVPASTWPHWLELTQDPMHHRYRMDGPVFSGDVNLGDDSHSDWRTVVVASPGRGGPGYVVLDATDASFEANDGAALNRMWLDTTDGSDHDLGHITHASAAPSDDTAQSSQIVRLNNDRWALLVGNGINSSSGLAVLVIQYLDGARERIKLTTPTHSAGERNGLGAPAGLDWNADGRIDWVYAGDMQGQLWRFDLRARTAADWVASPQPLFLASSPVDGVARAQAMGTAPVLWARPGLGVQVVWATGRRLSPTDERDPQTQSVYSLLDHFTPGAAWPYTRADLQDQAYTPSGPVLAPQATSALGWFVDLPKAGERVIDALRVSEDALVWIASVQPGQAPQQTSCDQLQWGQDQHWVTVLHAFKHVEGLNSAEPNRIQTDSPSATVSTPTARLLLTGGKQAPHNQGIAVDSANSAPELRRIAWREIWP